MKVTHNVGFKPISITLETLEDLIILHYSIGSTFSSELVDRWQRKGVTLDFDKTDDVLLELFEVLDKHYKESIK